MALKVNPDHRVSRNNLVWHLATHPDDEVRDGQEALRLVTDAIEQSGDTDALILDLLAAAQAECGLFDEAVTSARKAVAMARFTGQDELVDELEDRRVLYEREEPYREEPLSGRWLYVPED